MQILAGVALSYQLDHHGVLIVVDAHNPTKTIGTSIAGAAYGNNYIALVETVVAKYANSSTDLLHGDRRLHRLELPTLGSAVAGSDTGTGTGTGTDSYWVQSTALSDARGLSWLVLTVQMVDCPTDSTPTEDGGVCVCSLPGAYVGRPTESVPCTLSAT